MTYPNAVNTTIFSSAGIAAAQWAVVNTLGIPVGPTGSLGVGLDAGLSRYIGIKTGGAASAEPRKTDATGDNGRFRHSYMFNPADISQLELSFGAMNFTLAAMAQGIKNFSLGDWEFIGGDTDAAAGSTQICLFFHVDAQDADQAAGVKRYLNYIYPVTTLMPLFGQHQEAQAMEWPWRAQPTQAGRAPWGQLFTKAVFGFTRAAYLPATSTQYPLCFHTFVRDGATQAFTLDYSPASDHSGTQIRVWNTTAAGVNTLLTATTDYTVNIATKTVTLTAVGTPGDIVTVLYEAFDLLD